MWRPHGKRRCHLRSLVSVALFFVARCRLASSQQQRSGSILLETIYNAPVPFRSHQPQSITSFGINLGFAIDATTVVCRMP